MDEIRISEESPSQSDVLALIRALDDYQNELYPPESNHLLDAASLATPNVRFYVARQGGVAVGCGALCAEKEYSEVKRMYVPLASRGKGIGKHMLMRLIEDAQKSGVRLLRLETGIHQHEAIALYRAFGFIERSPFGKYSKDPLSVFMELRL